MKSLLFLVCAVLFVGILAAGCTSPAPVPPATTVPTPAPTPVPTVMVTVVTVPALKVSDPALIGTWTYKGAMMATGSGQMPVIANTQSIKLTFNNDGTLTGFSGCNNFNGGYTLSGKTTEFGKEITIGPLVSTKMYCADTADFETSYLNNLQKTLTYSIPNNTMMLRTSYGSQLSYDKA
jgi:heat shock protein HslJ